MKKFSLVFILVSIVINVFSAPKIILKFDDLSVKSNSISCQSVMNLLIQKQIKASFGIIADRCDQTALQNLSPYLNATNSTGETLFEVWHHGLDHKNPEFGGQPYAYQKSHFEEADSLITAYLNIQMRTFGAPFNANDDNTVKVVSENKNYKVTLFGHTPPVGADYINLNNRVNIETSTANPSYSAFVDNYNAKKNTYTDYMVLQAHPNNWSASKLLELEKTLDFLISEGCEFITPYGYYLSLYGDVTSTSEPVKHLTNDNGGNNFFTVSSHLSDSNITINLLRPSSINILIYSFAGNLVLDKKAYGSNIEIVHAFPAGVYILSITDDNNRAYFAKILIA